MGNFSFLCKEEAKLPGWKLAGRNGKLERVS